MANKAKVELLYLKDLRHEIGPADAGPTQYTYTITADNAVVE